MNSGNHSIFNAQEFAEFIERTNAFTSIRPMEECGCGHSTHMAFVYDEHIDTSRRLEHQEFIHGGVGRTMGDKWPQKLCSVAVYICPNCGEVTAKLEETV